MAADGSIVSWGSCEHGQTGQGKQGKVECVSEKIILQSIPQNEDVKISCGASYTVCVTNGKLTISLHKTSPGPGSLYGWVGVMDKPNKILTRLKFVLFV